ncbi:hypothetical protein AALO_G00143960 [Alosa alosa]|uniref:Uncharacterized protein n=1 Tax=Alosa alosa TaxID=278164 RepID=A0AAV6GIW7_9TELE|nr:hypothetical protein AALO_G00143960 [Alosa alosa]
MNGSPTAPTPPPELLDHDSAAETISRRYCLDSQATTCSPPQMAGAVVPQLCMNRCSTPHKARLWGSL